VPRALTRDDRTRGVHQLDAVGGDLLQPHPPAFVPTPRPSGSRAEEWPQMRSL
jgi:hypothetical protein